MKAIYNKRISKNGNIVGKETIEIIKSCKDCHWKYERKCDLTKKELNADNSIPDYCPLDDYKGVENG